jgi:hypothetical protein
MVKIRSGKLTTPQVAPDGSSMGLEFLDEFGGAVSVEFPLDQAEAIAMTLPRLLSQAVKLQTGNADARYVFSLEGWRIEEAKGQQCLIATLATKNGFEVSFAIPFEACHQLSWNLRHSVDVALGAPRCRDESIAASGIKLN